MTRRITRGPRLSNIILQIVTPALPRLYTTHTDTHTDTMPSTLKNSPAKQRRRRNDDARARQYLYSGVCKYCIHMYAVICSVTFWLLWVYMHTGVRICILSAGYLPLTCCWLFVLWLYVEHFCLRNWWWNICHWLAVSFLILVFTTFYWIPGSL